MSDTNREITLEEALALIRRIEEEKAEIERSIDKIKANIHQIEIASLIKQAKIWEKAGHGPAPE
jgi:hypothetical protein